MAENQFEARRAILIGDVGDIRHQRNAAVLRNHSLNPIVTMKYGTAAPGSAAIPGLGGLWFDSSNINLYIRTV